MAISWFTALKAIPWSDVLEAAPHVVKGARALLARTRASGVQTAPDDVTTAAAELSLAELSGRVRALGDRVKALEAERAASAELIRTLAEQNDQLVRATGILRVRTRLLLWTTAALALVVAGMLIVTGLR